ncbi:hypothetical protein ASF41_02235 [Methylobacterium sp. Leaf111]|uniref:DUF3306 domain-containing protein n=1 Tax=Methylobacterium sp. Leaf111 TaxID=1736257 RepID=UPI0006F82913|nr:DUF3306 domain-containing protein [Methylobacterium sp. Leaf111]KQP76615.1 hypothetical protein ASF41_02235 [Methylobacterium sp. Leaf111]
MSESLLSRWARRKQEVRQHERAQAVTEPSALAVPPEPQVVDEALVSSEPALDDESLADAIARLPKIEDLTAETELVPFLRAGIPAALRKAALRRMWSVDPAIRDFVSEAREYAYDWNTPGGVPGLGPMLPTDDITAMVERIMTGHAPKPPQEPVGIQEGDVEVAPSTVPVADETAAETQMVSIQDTPTAHVGAEDLHPSQNGERTFQSAPIVSPLRRHGGAMPS